MKYTGTQCLPLEWRFSSPPLVKGPDTASTLLRYVLAKGWHLSIGPPVNAVDAN